VTLTQAIQNADLPALLEQHFPNSGARAGKKGRIKCVWRGGSDLSGNLFINKRGKWQLHDFVTGETWDTYSVLTELVGMTKSQAAAELTGEKADATQKKDQALKSEEVELPPMPEELSSWLWVHQQLKIPLWSEPMSDLGKHCLELLAEWMAECIELELAKAE
jgi:hypothetical protein